MYRPGVYSKDELLERANETFSKARQKLEESKKRRYYRTTKRRNSKTKRISKHRRYSTEISR